MKYNHNYKQLLLMLEAVHLLAHPDWADDLILLDW